MIPLYGFVDGDVLGVIVMMQDDETVADLAQRLQQAVAVRVRPRPRMFVLARGTRLSPDATIHDAGLAPLDRVDVVPEER